MKPSRRSVSGTSRVAWLGFLLLCSVLLPACVDLTQKVRFDENGVPRAITIVTRFDREALNSFLPADFDTATIEDRALLALLRPEEVTDEEYLELSLAQTDLEILEAAEEVGNRTDHRARP